MYARKDNRQYKITEDEKKKYIGLGYRIGTLVDGEIVFEDEVKEDVTEIKKELEEVKKERATLKGQLTKATKRIEELEGSKEVDK